MAPRYDSYERYRPSGIEWQPEIPAHWEVCPLKATVKDQVNGIWGAEPANDDTDVLCVRVADFDRTRFRIAPSAATMRSIETGGGAPRFLRPGDLLLEKSGGGERQPVGAVVLVDESVAQPAVCSNFIARLRVAAGYEPRFLVYLHADLYSAGIQLRSVKQSTGIQNLDASSYLTESVALPSFEEQAVIADFLDRETAKIDHLIEEKQRLIELLEEKRNALITQAVTKGMDPDVEMKESGVEWLGAIPSHWAPIPLRHLSPKITVGIVVTPSKYYTSEGVPALRSLNVRPNGIDLKEIVYIGEDANRLHAKSILREDDLVTVRTGRPGTTVVVPKELDGVNAIDLIITRCPHEMVPEYLAHFMNSDVAKHQYLLGSGGAIQQHFNVEVAKRLTVLVPPLNEQNEIVATLSESLLRLNSLSNEVLKATDLLREYRTALISAAVTGKIDVREEAA